MRCTKDQPYQYGEIGSGQQIALAGEGNGFGILKNSVVVKTSVFVHLRERLKSLLQ